MPPTMDPEASQNTAITGSQGQNSVESQFVDLTLSDDSASDVDSIIGSTSESTVGVDEKPQTPVTSDSSHNEGVTARLLSPAASSDDQSQDSDENDMKVCMSLIRKRKRDVDDSHSAAALKRTKANGSPMLHSGTNTQTFVFKQLSNISKFFGGLSQPSDNSPRAIDRKAGGASQEETSKDKTSMEKEEGEADANKKARKETVISHPFLLNHVREKTSRRHGRSRTGRQPSPNNCDVAGRATIAKRACGRSKPSEATTTTTVQRRASSADPPVAASKRRHATFADVTAPRQNDLPVDSKGKRNANQSPYAGRSGQVRPLPVNTNRADREGSLFDHGTANQESAPRQTNAPTRALPYASGITARRDGVENISLSKSPRISATSTTSSDHAVKRPDIPTSLSTYDATHARPQPSEPSQAHETRGEFDRGRRSGANPEYAQPTETKWERISRLDKSSTGKKATQDTRLSSHPKPMRPQPRLRGEPSQAWRGETSDSMSRAEDQWLKAQRPQPSSTRIHPHSQLSHLAHHNGSGFIAPRPRDEFRQPIQEDASSNIALAESHFLRQQQPRPVSMRSSSQSQAAHQNDTSDIACYRRLPTIVDQQLRRDARSEACGLANTGSQEFRETREKCNSPVRGARSLQAREVIKAPTTLSRPAPRPPPLSGDVLANAAADMKALYAQHEKARTTRLVDSLPADLSMAQHDHRSRARAVRNIEVREREMSQLQEQQIKAYRLRIVREVRKKFAHESDEFQESKIQERFNAYLEKKTKKDLNRRERWNRGLLTAELLEGNNEGGFNGEEVDLCARKTPVSRVLQTAQTIVYYPVYMTKPLEEGLDYEDFLERTKAFGKLDSANVYARRLLEGPSSLTSRRSKDKARQVQSQSITYPNGQLFGSLKLGDGKTMYVMVRKDLILSGDLNPDVLRNKWVDDDVVELYRARYDVFLYKFVPKSWQCKEEEDKKARAKREQRQELDCKRRDKQERKKKKKKKKRKRKRQPKTNVEMRQAAAEEEGSMGLEGSRLRAALQALSVPGSQPQLDSIDVEDEEVEEPAGSDDGSEENSDEDTDDETASQASESTMCYSSPAPGPPPGRYTERNEDEDVVVILEGSYTDRQLANEAAFRLAEAMWKPRNPDINAVNIYKEEVLPRLRQAREAMDLDSDLALYTFKVAEFTEHYASVDHRPWGFKESRVAVYETELKGPRDFAVDFVMDMSDYPYRPTTTERAAENVRLAGDQDGDIIDLEDSGGEGVEATVQNDIDHDEEGEESGESEED